MTLPPAPPNIALAPLGQPRILVSNPAIKARLQNLLTANEPTAVRFKSMVNSQMSGSDFWGFENWNAALIGVLTNSASHCTYAVSKVDAIVASEEQQITATGHPEVSKDDYLHLGDYISDVALVYDWCRPQMTNAMRTRWTTYANQAVFNAWYRHTWNMTPQSPFYGSDLQQPNDYTPWGANNPRNNYYYSFLKATVLLGLATQGENAMADGWLGQYRTAKIGSQLIPVFNQELTGGGSKEGIGGYGTAMNTLFQGYYWWEASTGNRIFDMTPHTKDSLAAMMHTVVPTLDRYATTGDQSRDELGIWFDYQRTYVQSLMAMYPTDRLAGIAKTFLAQANPAAQTQAFMFYSDFLYNTNAIAAQPLTDLSPTYYASGIGMFATRSAWTTSAAYANFICGANDESHAHNDQGSFTLYRGDWLAFDANQIFTSGLAQSEHVHNLVRFTKNGNVISQDRYHQPCQMRAVADNANYAYASANLMPVWANYGGSNIVKAERRFLFVKPGVFVVFDPVQTAGAGMARIWTLNVPGPAAVSGSQFSYTSGPNRLDVFKVSPATAFQATSWSSVPPLDWSEVPKGGTTAQRIDVVDTAGTTSNFLHVLGTNGAVIGTPVQDDATGQVGVRFAVSGSRTVTVRFNTTGDGGTIRIDGPGGAVIVDEALPTTLQSIPLFAN